MQLSTSTFPLDPSLAAAPAVGSAAVASGLGTATDGDTPAFSTLLSSESTAAAQTDEPAPGSSLFSTSAATTSDSLIDGETVPTAETEQEAIAAWLAANGFPPPAPPIVIVAPELLSTDAAPVDGPQGVPGWAAPETRVTEGSGAIVSTTALREAAETAPEASSASDASGAAIPGATVETTTPSAARPRHADDAIAAYEASAGAVAGDVPVEKSRLRAKSAAVDAVLPRREPFSFVGAERTVLGARASIAQPATSGADPASSAPEAAEAEAMAEGLAATLAPTSVPCGPRSRSDARAGGPQSVPAVPTAGDDSATVARPGGGTEKFAVAAEKLADTGAKDSFGGEKNSLSFVDKEVTGHQIGFGINAAKTEVLMSASATSAAPSTATGELERVLPVPATFETLFTETEQTTTTLVQAARRSVESALNVAEQFASGDKRAVTLQFSVSGVDLGVRVELRGDGVHTTFRTDSPELRAALAQEWQSVAAGQGSDRTARFVDPVFTAASPGNSQQGDASTGQRYSQPRQDRQMADDLAALQVAPRIKTQTSVSPVPVALARGTSVSTSSRLHTFA